MHINRINEKSDAKTLEKLVKEYSMGDLVVEIYIRKIVKLLENSKLPPLTVLKITIGVGAVTRELRERAEFKENFCRVQQCNEL